MLAEMQSMLRLAVLAVSDGFAQLAVLAIASTAFAHTFVMPGQTQSNAVFAQTNRPQHTTP
jgi:hypothetical protein